MYLKAYKVNKQLILGLGVLLVLLIIFPNLNFPRSSYILSVATQTLLFVYLANSWNILSGFTGLFSLGHASFFGLGAYACAIMMVQVDLPGMPLIGKYLLGILVGIVCSLAFGALVSYIATRLKGMFFSMTTLAMCEVLRTFALQSNLTNGNIGIIIPPQFSVGPKGSFYIILAMCCLAFLLTWYLKNTRTGRMMIAIRENESLAASLGVNLNKWIYIAVFISAVLASLGGAYYPLYLSHIEPTSTFDYAITMQMMIVCIAGGKGHVLGPAVGGIAVILNEFIRSNLTKMSSGATSFASIAGLLYGLILLLIILFMPGGLISLPDSYRAWKEKKRLKQEEKATMAEIES